MSARPCPIALFDCIGVDSPITGLSSESPDPVLYYAYCKLFFDPYAPPPLGGGINPRTNYQNIIFAAATQASADAEAEAACSPISPFLTPFTSEEVTVSLPCTLPDFLTDDQGNVITDDQGNKISLGGATTTMITVTLPAGYITGLPGESQADVNAAALAVATAQCQAQVNEAGCQESTA